MGLIRDYTVDKVTEYVETANQKYTKLALKYDLGDFDPESGKFVQKEPLNLSNLDKTYEEVKRKTR